MLQKLSPFCFANCEKQQQKSEFRAARGVFIPTDFFFPCEIVFVHKLQKNKPLVMPNSWKMEAQIMYLKKVSSIYNHQVNYFVAVGMFVFPKSTEL